MKDQIIKVIAEYLNKTEVPKEKWDGTVGFFPAEWPLPMSVIAAEIAEKLLPIVGEKDYPYTNLFDYMAIEHGLALTDTELGDIIHIARGK
jgi:hypothetical protein